MGGRTEAVETQRVNVQLLSAAMAVAERNSPPGPGELLSAIAQSLMTKRPMVYIVPVNCAAQHGIS